MAAVQCLYTQSFHASPPGPATQVAALKARLSGNKNEQKLVVGSAIEPNYNLVESLLSGIAENTVEINHRMDGVLSDKWKRDRMSAVLIAILQCAIYELFFGKEISPKIIVDEYARITRSFFGDTEVDFVYAALSALIQQYG